MTFARRVFFGAAVYGFLVLTPQFFMEEQIGKDYPPAVTHPEFFYGFLGVALAWQAAFLIVARDPIRYRAIMIPGVLEKIAFGAGAVVLFIRDKVPATVLAFGCVDLVLALMFLLAYRKTAAALPASP